MGTYEMREFLCYTVAPNVGKKSKTPKIAQKANILHTFGVQVVA